MRRDDLPMEPPKRKRLRFSWPISVPRWFKKFFFYWLAFILTVAAIAYVIYAFSGEWTPAHMLDLIKLGV